MTDSATPHRDLRREYMELDAKAHGILAEINKLQMELKDTAHELFRTTTKLINAAESHGSAAIDELEATRGQPKKKTVKYNFPSESTSIVEQISASMGSKRKCSICREPGHRATTCPKAHLLRKGGK